MRIHKFFLITCLWISCNYVDAQIINGKIFDQKSKQPIPFVFVGAENSHRGTMADVDGSFKLSLDSSINQLTVFITGYHKKIIPVNEINTEKPLFIYLEANNISLPEIVVRPKENPANELIRRLIKNKEKLDPRNLNFYYCETYSKTYFTLSDRNGKEDYYNVDTAKYKEEKKLLDKQYLFFIESASEKKYRYKNIQQEKIIASRVSGFKSAPFASLASQLQSFTFFDDKISVMDVKYINPLLKGTFKRYQFEITDTIYEKTDTTILIMFKPRKDANFKALQGTIYLNKNQYALARVIAEPANNINNANSVKIQQLYERVDSIKWFPTQLVTEILFNNVNANTDNEKDNKPARILKCVSRVYVSNVKLDSALIIKKKNIEVINANNYEKQPESFWEQKRNDTLSGKEKYTYHIIDSVGEKTKLEKKLKWAKVLMSGMLPLVGPINLDLKHLLRGNDYEGFRLGTGLITGDKLSPWFSIGGYTAYGFKDKAWKYGGQIQINFSESKAVNLKLEAARDVFETANFTFLESNATFISNQNIRPFLVGVMDKKSFAKASLQFPIYRFIKNSVYFQSSEIISPSGYGNSETQFSDLQNNFITHEAGLQIKFWPGEKFTESFLGLISLGSKAPCFFVNFSKALPMEIYGHKSNVTYSKVDMRINHKLFFKVRGYFSWSIQTGKVFGDVPYTFQFNNNGSRISALALSCENTFETMFLNEFISTEYAHLFLTYNTGKIIRINKYFNPEIELLHNIGHGNLTNREKLTGILLNDLSKGYSEAGIRVKNMYQSGISSFGLGVFYRYGNYALENPKNNIVVKLVLSINVE